MIPVREHRTDRTVDQTAGQNGLLAGTTFTFDKAAGDFTDSVHFFFKIYSQRKEVYSFPGCFCTSYRNNYCGIAITNQYGSICLLSDLTDFHGKRSAAKLHTVSMHSSASSKFSQFRLPDCIRHKLRFSFYFFKFS